MKNIFRLGRFHEGHAGVYAARIIFSFVALTSLAIIGLAYDDASAAKSLVKWVKVQAVVLDEQFDFKVPSDWQRADATESEVAWTAGKLGYVLSISVEETDDEAHYQRLVTAPKAFLDAVREILTDEQGFQIKKISSAKIGGRKAAKVEGSFATPEGDRLYGAIYFFAGGEGQQVILVTAAPTAKAYTKAAAIFQTMLGSLKYVPAAPSLVEITPAPVPQSQSIPFGY